VSWRIVSLFAVAGLGVGMVGRHVLRAVRAEVPAGWCEVVSALLWAFVAWRWSGPGKVGWWLPVPLSVTAFAVPLVLADLKYLRLPNVLTAAAYPVLGAAIGIAASQGGSALGVRAVAGAVVFGGAHALVHRYAPGSLGAGDVKLAGSAGAVLGAVGWASLLVGVCLASALTAALSAVRALPPGRLAERWRGGVPHGPGLLAATWLIAVFPGAGAVAGR
jgi:leader peptidase (prepilin peptidase)/N-methyltransferase